MTNSLWEGADGASKLSRLGSVFFPHDRQPERAASGPGNVTSMNNSLARLSIIREPFSFGKGDAPVAGAHRAVTACRCSGEDPPPSMLLPIRFPEYRSPNDVEGSGAARGAGQPCWLQPIISDVRDHAATCSGKGEHVSPKV